MASDAVTADTVVADLEALASDDELPKVRRRLAPGEPAFGVRMRDLFDTAKAHTDLPLPEVERLLEHPAYEPRMAAVCLLDFQTRRRLDDDERHRRYQLYLDRHDRITTWDMVDRAAPRVVGGYLAGRSPEPLHELARAPEPLRRRTAVTAPLYFVRSGSDEDLAAGFTIAGLLAADPDPSVHNAVGIYLKHAGTRDEAALHRFLDTHAATMPRATLRLATEKLAPEARALHRT